MNLSASVWLVIIGIVVSALLLHREHKRTVAIKAMAVRLGFVFIGRALPRSVVLDGTPIEFLSSVWNVIDGEHNGVRVVAFDCRIGSGKTSWRRTIIVAQSSPDIFAKISFTSDLSVACAGKWVILYQPKAFSFIPAGLMPLDELEARLNGLGG